ncbi:ThiF family adenylyltransferase [Nonomuraea sp. NPDC050680]|uniref:ThiF family adenylyltransferase n=1 Tax=Nonomuraea sp. NPDC050680 TaxID=3154630 RepID=UPI003410251F
MRPRVKPALRRIVRDEQTLQLGAHPLRAVLVTGSVHQWVSGLDGTRDLGQALRDGAAAGLAEADCRAMLDQLAAQGVLEDAAVPPVRLSLGERDRLAPDLDALDLAGGSFSRRRRARVRVYGAGRVGAQVVALLAACGVGAIRVFDEGQTRPRDLTPGGLTWSELGMSRQDGAVAVARRLTSGGPLPPDSALPGPAALGPMAPGPAARGLPARGPAAPGPTARGTAAPGPTSRGSIARGPAAAGDVAERQAGRPGGTGRTGRAGGTSGTSGIAGDGTDGTNGIAGSDGTVEIGGTGKTGGTGGRSRQRSRAAARPADGSALPGTPSMPSTDARAGGPHLGDGSDLPDLVILASVTPLDGVLVNELTALSIPHLLVSAFEGHGSVGPLVLPGETACLHCLDLARRDADPAWPIVTARLGGYPPGEIACDATLATLVAAAATGHALAYIDGRDPVVTNGTLDVMPDWQWKTRSWTRHPQCRCMRNHPYRPEWSCQSQAMG